MYKSWEMISKTLIGGISVRVAGGDRNFIREAGGAPPVHPPVLRGFPCNQDDFIFYKYIALKLPAV